LHKINPALAETQALISRDSKKKYYKKLIDAKIDKFSKEISLSPFDFSKNLKSNQLVARQKRMPTSPALMAETYRCTNFDSIIDVLIATCTFIADELAAYPVIRK